MYILLLLFAVAKNTADFPKTMFFENIANRKICYDFWERGKQNIADFLVGYVFRINLRSKSQSEFKRKNTTSQKYI